MMYMELKKAIIAWLFNNPKQWPRVNSCVENFRAYIYDSAGNYLIGGEDVRTFIIEADRLIYARKEENL